MSTKQPDRKKAQSLMEIAKREIKFTASLEVTEQSSPTIIRNIYEAFRMLGEAFLEAKGIRLSRGDHHKQVIDELAGMRVRTQRPLRAIDNLRKLRHNVNYYGYKPSVKEAEDALDLAGKCFDALYAELERAIT